MDRLTKPKSTTMFLALLLLCSTLASAVRISAVTSFELWDAEKTEVIGTLRNGAKIPMREGGFNVRAVLNRRIGSLNFSHNGKQFHIEHYGPYFFCADKGGAPFRCESLVEGTHTIVATPFAFSHARGPSATANTVTFTIVPAATAGVPAVGGTVIAPVVDPKPVVPDTVVSKPAPVSDVPDTTAIPPLRTPSKPTNNFQEIRINCGGPMYTDAYNNVWSADKYFDGGDAYSSGKDEVIARTTDDVLYQSERYGEFEYEIPVPEGDYQVILHFAEVFYTAAKERQFGLVVEDHVIPEFDIVLLAGESLTAMKREVPVLVSDGSLSIKTVEFVENPKISAIEVKQIGPHLAHSVPGGPYSAVAGDDGFGIVAVDGTQSHTHAPEAKLTTFSWKEGSLVLGVSSLANLKLPVGSHDVTLKVTDDAGNDSIAGTVVNILPAGFPDIAAITPNRGKLDGGEEVVIVGKGFKAASGIQFGSKFLPKTQISVQSDSQISFLAPPNEYAVPVAVAVETALGESNSELFTYEADGLSIEFTVEELLKTERPTTVAFGPDSKLYIGSSNGEITKCTLDETFTKVVSTVTSKVAPGRFVLGIAFDPVETVESNPNPTVYFSHSKMFHGEQRNSVGTAINGMISAATGPKLETVKPVVTGLPVSDHDHGVNGILFGDNGELYIVLGGNTNAGIPGELSASQKMNESVLSAATLVAHLGRADFDGDITYSKADNGDVVSGGGANGVEVFASGMRNPYRILLHSNGKLYGTDNGPNEDFGDVATGCGVGQQIPDKHAKDELNLVEKGKWYGHPNHKRAETSPRECTWNGPGHTPALMHMASSTDGLIEFQSDHFGGQMRGDLILSKFKDGLRRVILNEDGTGVHPSLDGEIHLQGDDGLDLTQAPNGNLIDARFETDSCYFFEPIEPFTTAMEIKSVFPRRGSYKGGTKISIYGVNFTRAAPLVSVGGKPCTGALWVSPRHIQCTLPSFAPGTTVDIKVTIGTKTDTFLRGYRYIKGFE